MSLLPLMKLRLASPETLIDIGRLEELKGAKALPDGGFEMGALVTYAEVLETTSLDFAKDTILGIGDVQVRNRGTVGGAIAHADPASDLPALGLALDYSVVLRSARGERVVPLDGFFEGRSRPASPPTRSSCRCGVVRCPPGRPARTASSAAGVRLLDRRGSRRGRLEWWVDLACPGRAHRGGRGGLPGSGRRGRAPRLGRVSPAGT